LKHAGAFFGQLPQVIRSARRAFLWGVFAIAINAKAIDFFERYKCHPSVSQKVK
jgi:hypothetical protein